MTPTSHTQHQQQASRQQDTIRAVNACGRIAKRSSNACSRCRRQKIKCSGTRPCDACSRRKMSCHFDDDAQKILVTRGYLASLQDRAANIYNINSESNETGHAGLHSTTHVNHDEVSTSWSSNTARRLQPQSPAVQDYEQPNPRNVGLDDDRLGSNASESPDVSSLTNPLSTGPSTFMLSDTGRTVYLGHSSNWSFTRRILSITYEHVHGVSLPSTALMFDSKVYFLDWTSQPSPAAPVLPNIDYAIHLVNIVKFHCNPMFHLFDEEVFMNGLHAHYRGEGEQQGGLVQQLWFIHFMLILAFGKAITSKPSKGNQPPGASFFMYAIQLLPNITVVWDEPVQAAEILCCIALYLHCIEHRGSAYNYIGQAVRLAMGHGLHTNLSSHHVENSRCRKLWWTIHGLDRQMTSLMGLPQSIRDDDVSAPLPTFEGDAFRTAAFAMRTRLSHFIATIDRAIYGPDGRLSSNFLLRTKETLASMAGLPDELHQQFPLDLNNKKIGISRLSAQNHILFHQCIILATRPVLFCFYKIRLETPHSYSHIFNSSQVVESLLRMCLDSSQHVISILECLQSEGLIESFLSYDLEALFISMTNLLTAPVLYQDEGSSWTSWRQKAYAILDEISKCGNLIAQYQQSELQHLEQMIDGLGGAGTTRTTTDLEQASQQHVVTSMTTEHPPVVSTGSFAIPEVTLPTPLPDDVLDGNYIGAGFSTAQIMDMVNSIDSEHSEWMSQAFLDS